MLSDKCKKKTKKTCKCLHGTAATGDKCEVDGANTCAECDKGFYLENPTMKCAKYTDCDAQGKQTKSQGTPTSDAQCGGPNQCKCDNGEAAASTDCPKHLNYKCVSCNTLYWLDTSAGDGVCDRHTDCDKQGRLEKTAGTGIADAVCGIDKECKCTNGSPATGILCPKHGNNTCISCRGKYYLENGSCLPWQDCDKQGKVETQRGSNTANAQCGRAKQCECDYGTGATGTACQRRTPRWQCWILAESPPCPVCHNLATEDTSRCLNSICLGTKCICRCHAWDKGRQWRESH